MRPLAIVLVLMQAAEKVQDLRQDPNMLMLTTSYWNSFRQQKMLKELIHLCKKINFKFLAFAGDAR